MKNYNQQNKSVFSKVLTIGPSRKCQGGMSSVLKLYSEQLPDFKHLATNSRLGTAAGAFALLRTLALMPFERLKGRKILHVHVASRKSFVRKRLIINWGKVLGYKTIYHCHGAQTQEFFRSIGLPKARHVINRCDAVICLSHWWKNYFDSALRHHNINVVYNPQHPVEHIAHPAHRKPLKLLFLGRLSDDKGIFELLEVFATNRDRWRGRVELTIGGAGETERLLNYIRENKLRDLVTFLGWVDGNDKEALYSNHHVLILPSYFEGLPMSILEAMGHGMPVISTPVGGIPEMIVPGENGILFNAGDKEAMSAAIDCYLLNPDLIERHGNAALQIVPKFYPEKIKNDLEKIYLSLLD